MPDDNLTPLPGNTRLALGTSIAVFALGLAVTLTMLVASRTEPDLGGVIIGAIVLTVAAAISSIVQFCAWINYRRAMRNGNVIVRHRWGGDPLIPRD